MVSATQEGETRVMVDSIVHREVVHPRQINSSRPDDYPKFMGHMAKLHHEVITAATINKVEVTKDVFRLFRSTINGTPLGRKLERFSYMRGKFRVRIAVQGSSVLAGKFVVAFQPFVQSGVGFGTRPTKMSDLTQPNCMVVPHLVIDPSKTESLEIVLDAPTPTGHWTMQSEDNYGSYRVVIFWITPLFSGTATVPDMSMTIYGGLHEDSTLEGITYLSGADGDNPFGLEEKKDTLPSTWAYRAGDVAGMVGTLFPALAPTTTIFSTVAGSVGNVLRAFGYARPPITQVVSPTLNKFADVPMHSSGPSTSLVLGASQTQSLGISPELAGANGDEMSFEYLCRIPGYAGKFVVGPAAAAGSVITHGVEVSPSRSLFDGPSGHFQPTPLAGIAECFDYWSGDIDIDIEVVASVFHRATILVAWDCSAAGASLTPTMEEAQNALPNYLLTVSGNTTVRLTVPWAQQTPWLFVKGIKGNVSSTRASRVCNGYLHLYVVNPLTSNGSTSPIDLNVYYSSRNIRFAAPNPAYITTTTADVEITAIENSGVIVPLSGDWKDSPNGSVFLAPATKTDFGPPSDLNHLGFRAFGETPMSVKELCMKMVPYINASITLNTTDAGEWIRMRIPNIPPLFAEFGTNPVATQTLGANVVGLSGFAYPSWLSYFASAYVGYRGGMRRGFTVSKLFGNDISPTHWVTYEPFQQFVTNQIVAGAVTPLQHVRDLNEYSAIVGNLDISPLLEVVVPSMIPLDFHVCGYESAMWGYFYHYFQVNNAESPTQLRWSHWVGAADDAMFVRFVGFPPVPTTGQLRP